MILVISGSRTLADDPRAERWARALISAAWDSDPRPGAIVTGDARGPDEWARREAVTRGVPFYCYAASGEITGKDARLWGRWTNELPPAPGEVRALWAAWYLHRDRVMIQHAARRFTRDGADVRVLALVDPASRTNGTGFTIDRAKAAHLPVQVETWGRP